MAAFDPVMAFVAFVSFIAGYVSARLGKRGGSYRFAPDAPRRKGGGYMRLGDKDSPGETGSHPEDIIAEKKSKFDTLFSEYSGGRRETGQYGGYSPEEQESPKSRGREHRSPASAQRKDPHYVEIPDTGHEERPLAGKPAAPPKNKEQKEEWAPMGFFED